MKWSSAELSPRLPLSRLPLSRLSFSHLPLSRLSLSRLPLSRLSLSPTLDGSSHSATPLLEILRGHCQVKYSYRPLQFH